MRAGYHQSNYIIPSILICFFFAGSALAIDQAPEPRQVFAKMMLAIDSLNYQGTVALYKNGKLDTMNYVHAVNQGQYQERLTALNTPLREIIRTSDKVVCKFSQTNDIVIDHRPIRRSFFMDLPNKLDNVDSNYDFILRGEESIARLPTRVLLIHPKDDLRYTRKIWVDQNSYLPLRFELIDAAGIALEQAIFIDIEIKDALSFVEIANLDDSNVKHIHQLEKLDFSDSKFVVDTLPPGFYQVFFTHRTLSDPDKLVEHLLLSDGFSSVSVYFEQGDDNSLESHLTNAGAINSYARQIGDYRLTVLGEVPIKTVQLIAEGIKLR